MAPLNVHIKHAGKVYDLALDADRPPLAFKEEIYQTTGIPLDRMKVMVKGGTLKDDDDWKKIKPKENQTFMVIGAAGELPKPPEKPIVFLEDMDDSELAQALSLPVGLRNLGNTCYMNATVQAFRAIPELQAALNAATPSEPLPRSLRDLYNNMSRTTDGVTPFSFLQMLRQAYPQFAEQSRGAKGGNGILDMGGYAQQDAEECWTALANSLKTVKGLPSSSTSASMSNSPKNFVEQYMMAKMRRELKCDEAPEEPSSIATEDVLKIECNISISTNYMHSGIMDALDQKIEKRSPTLGRDAVYTQKSRLERLPAYLSVHMVRFAWRRDINKKAKIMRKVKFPTEFDTLDLATDELKSKLLPASRRLKEIEKERTERRKVRKRTKEAQEAAQKPSAPGAASVSGTGDVSMETEGSGSVAAATTTTGGAASADADAEMKPVEEEKESEERIRVKEKAELEGLVDESVRNDVGSSETGLYELVAIITHKGAAADAGHYIGFVKRSLFHPVLPVSGPGSSSSSGAPGVIGGIEEGDEDWYKFDDEKVSVFPVEKLGTLDGGGEDASAYVLLYRSKPLA